MDQTAADQLVYTAPGTPMGSLLRRYWVPALMASEIAEPDGPQVRVQLLGEKLIAFRDSQGRIGVIDEFCSHRGVSLYFGRNEECGIRCAYHGLKFDVNGHCVDVPSAPQVAERMKIKAYPSIERAGMVWVYMGPPEQQPAPPDLEWCGLPAANVFVSKRLQECNWLQAMEGGIDTTHVSYTHRFEVDIDPMHRGTKANDYIKADGNVIFEIEKTPAGLTLFGRRNGEADSYYWRITQWLFPWFTLIPPFGHHALGGHVWVPIDDHSCWAWSINYHPDRALNAEELSLMRAGAGIHVAYEPGGSWRPLANRSNDYLLDRRAQREKRSYSGVAGISVQDASLQESMGTIQDRTLEKLLPTDRGIVMARRLLLEAVQALRDQTPGTAPPALDAATQRIRAAAVLLPRGEDPLAWAQGHITGLDTDHAQPVYSV